MKKSVFVAAQRIVKRGQERVSDNDIGRTIQHLCHVGRVSGKSILFNASERLKIDRYFSEHLGAPLRTIDFALDTRVKTSDLLIKEKWAVGTVFGDLVNMARWEEALPIIGDKPVFTPPGSVFSCRYELLDVQRVSKVVIVENGEVLTHWEQVRGLLPVDYEDAVILYRGHGQNQNGIRRIIDALPPSANIAMFMDCDAAGITLAKDLLSGRDGVILMPESDGNALTAHSDQSVYAAQIGILTKLLEDESVIIKGLAEKLRRCRLSVMQERMLSHGIRLVAHKI